MVTAPVAGEDGAGLRLSGLTAGHRADGALRGRRAVPVLSGVSAVAGRGELTVLLGPNGAGKSTLLRTLAGLQPALGGTAALDGEDLAGLRAPARARRIGVVLTERPDPGLLTGRDVVELGRLPHTGSAGVLGPADDAAVDAAIDAVRAGALAGRSLARLSDGERQRLMIARALAQEPSLLLLDEPSAFLDVAARVALLGLLRRLAREQGLCVLLSTHDLELALRLADRAWLLDGAGSVRTGTPAELAGAGAIGAAFDTDELAFEPATGTFRLRTGTA
ncbi:putative iron(III) ABC transporter, ATP-binding protein [Pseudonocardia sp. Ae168_Ps1]|nr:putative iron(III) ABC transporter, ATP-binding protein [Pseudonocardia sp. Ae150A_Ps1]OLL78666.1 putative iron(III) ABC transporter, ATP-binding protein [Pseudonocardia sp. Ae168_Ps1]OLL87205.1 putative iron(III) ABC transporter, ATP-binding protein [Pseudonocardia sp. Ae263_Ps1]OLL92765.1 putative iron(III) ABC transporter, ATP-binding protein [Pseudonocardia sp. Ae356_Ps1]